MYFLNTLLKFINQEVCTVSQKINEGAQGQDPTLGTEGIGRRKTNTRFFLVSQVYLDNL